MYCSNCGEDGIQLVECETCGAIRCEDCAIEAEVTSGYCRKHLKEKQWEKNSHNPRRLSYTIHAGVDTAQKTVC